LRYTLAVLLALGIGITTAVPAALAENLLLPADSGFATSPPNSAPGYNTGYGNVVGPSQPLWVVQFPL
jgi:hypothetical protein